MVKKPEKKIGKNKKAIKKRVRILVKKNKKAIKKPVARTSNKKKILALPILKKKKVVVKKQTKKNKVKPAKKRVSPVKKIKLVKIIKKKKPQVKSAKLVVLAIPKRAKSKVLPKPKSSKGGARKISKKSDISEFPAESLFKAKIKVIGVGGGGGSIVSEIGRSLEKATFVVADTDIRALKKKSGIKPFYFGEEFTHGLGTGVNVDLGRQAAESAKEKISEIFKDQDIIIFIASLGGGLGSGATQIFVEVAKEFGGITFGIFTMPFKFEGKNKYRIAQNALKSLRQSLNVSLVIPNEKIFKIIDANTAITEAFSIVNKSLIESLESLIDLIYNPGIINIDFADFKAILRGRGNTAFLNTVEEAGKNRAEKICEKVLTNPLLQNNNFEAEKILFNIAGSENLSMFEVEKVSSHIAKLNPKAKIIFGISKNAKLKNRIKTTILMTGGQTKEDVSVEKIELPAEVIKIAEIKKVENLTEEKKEILEKKVEQNKAKPQKAKKAQTQKRAEKKTKKNISKEKNGTTKKERLQKVKWPKKFPEQKPVSFIPVFEARATAAPEVDQSKLDIIEAPVISKNLTGGRHGTIRRSGLEIKKAEEQEEKKRIAQEKEWEIPAFLRRVKFKG
jgi:cell division protein FtsZ